MMAVLETDLFLYLIGTGDFYIHFSLQLHIILRIRNGVAFFHSLQKFMGAGLIF